MPDVNILNELYDPVHEGYYTCYDKNEMHLRFIDLFYTLFSSCIKQKDVRILIKRHGQNRPFWNK